MRKSSILKTATKLKLKMSLLLLIAGSLLLSGCGSKLACSNAKGGIRCETITSVYESIQAGEKIDDKKPWNFYYERSGKADSRQKQVQQKQGKGSSEDIASEVVRNLDIQDKKPLRLPTKIIGIWIAPWVDSQGDLRKSEMIYSEIQDKRGRWLFGEEDVMPSANFVTSPASRVIENEEKTEKAKEQSKEQQKKGVKK